MPCAATNCARRGDVVASRGEDAVAAGVVVGQRVQHAPHHHVDRVGPALGGGAAGEQLRSSGSASASICARVRVEVGPRAGDQVGPRGVGALGELQLAVVDRRADAGRAVGARQQRPAQEALQRAQRAQRGRDGCARSPAWPAARRPAPWLPAFSSIACSVTTRAGRRRLASAAATTPGSSRSRAATCAKPFGSRGVGAAGELVDRVADDAGVERSDRSRAAARARPRTAPARSLSRSARGVGGLRGVGQPGARGVDAVAPAAQPGQPARVAGGRVVRQPVVLGVDPDRVGEERVLDLGLARRRSRPARRAGRRRLRPRRRRGGRRPEQDGQGGRARAASWPPLFAARPATPAENLSAGA